MNRTCTVSEPSLQIRESHDTLKIEFLCKGIGESPTPSNNQSVLIETSSDGRLKVVHYHW